jgi:3-oxoacyl-[acyl-carrier protein] reductase
MELGLAGKKALITGGSRGLGLGIAHALGLEGVAVAICGRGADDLANATRRLGGPGKTAVGLSADVTNPEALAQVVDDAANRLGGLDLLVLNAGASFGGGLVESTADDWQRSFALNVLHPAHAVRCSMRHLSNNDSASIVLISSISGRLPSPPSSYSTAKAAETHLATVLAAEMATYGIRVNAVSPGSTLFDGGGWDTYRRDAPAQFEAFEYNAFPRHRLLTLSEVADVVCFVLSPRASGISGANIAVDAGQVQANSTLFWPRIATSGLE